MKAKLVNSILAIAFGLAVGSLAIPAPGQDDGPSAAKGKGKGPPAGPVKRFPDGTPDMQGNWTSRANSALFDIQDHPVAREGISAGKGIIFEPADGKIPYQPWALEKAKDLGLNHMIEESDLHCYMAGIPHQMYSQQGMQIRQPPGYVLFLWEYMHSFRTVALDGRPHIPSDIKLFMGDSIGHWKEDTLVTDVTNQNNRTWFDIAANFHSDQIHVMERITPADSNTINYEATLEDPKVYTKPWKIRFTYDRNQQRNYELMEFSCWEGERDLPRYTKEQGGTNERRR